MRRAAVKKSTTATTQKRATTSNWVPESWKWLLKNKNAKTKESRRPPLMCWPRAIHQFLRPCSRNLWTRIYFSGCRPLFFHSFSCIHNFSLRTIAHLKHAYTPINLNIVESTKCEIYIAATAAAAPEKICTLMLVSRSHINDHNEII